MQPRAILVALFAIISKMSRAATDAILEEINKKNRTHWFLKTLLAGGVMGGAWAIADEDKRAVLKLHDPRSAIPHNPDAATVIAYIRDHAYPTPKWLTTGSTKSGIFYAIQDFIPGKRLSRLDVTAAQIIVDLVSLQRTIHPPTSMNWSMYMREYVFHGHPSNGQLTVAGGSISQALQESLSIAAPYKGFELEEHEMVHSDLSLSNILVEDGHVLGVVDTDAVGRGCAVYDVLSGALNGVIWDADPEAVNLLHSYAIETYGSAPVAIAAGTLVIEGLEWRMNSFPGSVEKAAQRSIAWLSRVRALL